MKMAMMRQGEPALTFRCLVTVLLAAALMPSANHDAFAQSAPWERPPAAEVQGGSTPSVDDCKNEFAPLRDEAARRGRLVKDASARHAPTDETCGLLRSYVEAEIKMIDFVEAHATACAVPAPVLEQLKRSSRTTEALQVRICNVAQQPQK